MTRNFKKILRIVLIVLAVVLVGTISAKLISNNSKDYEKVNLTYKIGAIDENGIYAESDKSLYTYDTFDLNGFLKVEIDFDNNIEYQVFFYNESSNFVASSDVLRENKEFTLESEHVKARIVITPVWDDDVKDEDKTIGTLSKSKYTKQLTIFVGKESKVNEYDKVYSVIATCLDGDAMDSTQITLHTSDNNLLTNKYWYRILLNDADETGYYEISEITKSGDTYSGTYEYILASYTLSTDINFEEIWNAINTSGRTYYVKIEDYTSTSKKVSFSQNIDKLD